MSVEATLATWRLCKKQVTSTEKLFLLSCANRAGESHECWPSIKRLCADTGMDRKTIINVRQSVIDKGLLVYTGSFRGRSSQVPVMQLTYVDNSVSEFSTDNDKNPTSPKSTTSPKNGTGTGTENGTGDQSQKRDTESKRGNLSEEPIKPPISPKGGSVRFEEFWNIYPVKEAKKTCLQKWKRLGLDEIADEIIAKVDLQRLNDRKWLAGFPPNPLTYINQERWNDELDTRVRGTTPKQQSTDNFHNTMAKYKKAPTDGYYDEHGNFTANYL